MELFARAVRGSPGRGRRQPGSQGVSHAVHALRLRGTDPMRLTASSFTMVSSFLTGTSGSMFTTTSPVGREEGPPLHSTWQPRRSLTG